ncbi:peptidase inhibitor I78 family protein [Stutzerimonas stutzeri]|uniref:Peptidase inhibitor I78 family protein n=1 Tax=Stutzerimonas stutzeri TaxID=316 RepID=A0A2N8T863_STUST|nr:I78 family peptidase inhibitor [Stutzerimonas stutzeri]MCQ4324525.1 I78 family peptidase inhibitor [Stutzerimonas stutzeri]PNG10943.1 peptidase inhibitor I78 family protein [Stutzerimonas stutzeri]
MRPLHPLIGLTMAAAFLAGCQTNSTAKNADADTNSCNADAVQHFIGKTATADLLEEARNQAGANVARILRPGDVVTLEYNSRRLNLNTDASLTIERINCG